MMCSQSGVCLSRALQEEGAEVKAHSPVEAHGKAATGVAAHSVAEMRRPSALGFAASFLRN